MYQLNNRNKIRKILTSIVFTTIFSYVCYHTVSGDRGMIALFKLTQKVNKLQAELDILRAERVHLEHRVSLVKSESIDLDLIDEQARRILGYADPDESIYFIKNEEQ